MSKTLLKQGVKSSNKGLLAILVEGHMGSDTASSFVLSYRSLAGMTKRSLESWRTLEFHRTLQRAPLLSGTFPIQLPCGRRGKLV